MKRPVFSTACVEGIKAIAGTRPGWRYIKILTKYNVNVKLCIFLKFFIFLFKTTVCLKRNDGSIQTYCSLLCILTKSCLSIGRRLQGTNAINNLLP
jgi:hypothetical protein